MIRKDEKQRKGNTAKKETQEVIMENETRIAVIGIIIEDKSQAGAVNELLHQYGNYIIGRMGLPYEKKKVNIISIVLDIISALSGKLGRLWGVSSKALYTKTGEKACEEQRREE
jgi:putative iron-only hydrogenase system regulator